MVTLLNIGVYFMKDSQNVSSEKKNIPYYVNYIAKHWNKPPTGKYLTFREWFAYSVGGMGAVGASVLLQYVTLVQGLYVAAALGIDVMHVQYVAIFTSVFTILTSPLMSYIVDNTNTKIGKFRPYLIILPIPFIVLLTLTAFVPTLITNYIAMLIVFAILFNLANFVVRLYTLSINSLLQVITPNPQERTALMSFGCFCTSLGPSIATILYPALANLLYSHELIDAVGEIVKNDKGDPIIIAGINTMPAMQIVLPIMAACFLAVGLLAAFGTKERVVVPKKYVQKVKFKDGIISTFKNKYFWITNISTSLTIFKLILTTYVGWICSYSLIPSITAAGYGMIASLIQSIFTLIVGFANVPGMLVAPLLIKKFGKRNLLICTNIIITLLMIPAIFVPTQPYLIMALIFLVTLLNGVQVVTGPAMVAEMYDYQQYVTGRREEGFLSQFGVVITTGVGIATGIITPAVQKMAGYSDDASVLFDSSVLGKIISTMCLIGIASAIIGTIPYLFWDLSEKRHGEIIDILKIRKKVEDEIITAEEGSAYEMRIKDGETNLYKELFEEMDNEQRIKEAEAEANERAERAKNFRNSIGKKKKTSSVSDVIEESHTEDLDDKNIDEDTNDMKF